MAERASLEEEGLKLVRWKEKAPLIRESILTNFHAWQILRLLSDGEKGIRGIQSAGFRGSFSTLEKYVKELIEAGLIWSETDKHKLRLTWAGGEALRLLDEIGKIERQARRKARRWKRDVPLER